MNMIGAIKSLPDTRLVDCPHHTRTPALLAGANVTRTTPGSRRVQTSS